MLPRPRREWRHEEGRIGKDKRECKQEKRGEGDEDKGAEADNTADG